MLLMASSQLPCVARLRGRELGCVILQSEGAATLWMTHKKHGAMRPSEMKSMFPKLVNRSELPSIPSFSPLAGIPHLLRALMEGNKLKISLRAQADPGASQAAPVYTDCGRRCC